MKTAVRFYSRSGNTRAVAEAIAKAAGVPAISVDAMDAGLGESVDVLFVGGALYAYGIDKKLQAYLDSLTKEQVGKAVVFSTSWLSKHALVLIKRTLSDKGISVAEETFYVKNKPNEKQLTEAEQFARRFVQG